MFNNFDRCSSLTSHNSKFSTNNIHDGFDGSALDSLRLSSAIFHDKRRNSSIRRTNRYLNAVINPEDYI